MSVENIFHDNKLIAQKFIINEASESTFPTPDNCELQFGIGVVNEQKFFKPHIHKEAKRIIYNTSEFIYVVDGEMIIEFFHLMNILLDPLKIKKNEGFSSSLAAIKLWQKKYKIF